MIKIAKVLFFLAFFCFAGCNENPVDEMLNKEKSEGTKERVRDDEKLLTTPTFDIDSAARIYYPEANTNYVSLPWNSAGSKSQFIPIEWVNDHYTEDGWRLIYNTFEKPDNHYPFFAIYNIYRGVIRFFFYPYVGDIDNNDVVFIIKTGEKDETNLLNFEFPFAEAMENKYSTPLIQKVPNIDLQGRKNIVQAKCWYAAEFELSYDPSIENINSDLQLTIGGADISKVSLDGQYEDVTGDITNIPIRGSNFLGNFSTTKTSTIADVIINDLNDVKGDKPGFYNHLLDELQQAAGNTNYSSVEDVVNDILSQEVNWTTNPISNFLSNIVGGNTQNNEAKVDLSLKSVISFEESILSNNSLITQENFNIPTTNYNYGMGQYIPAYGKKLGVWTIDKTPEADYKVKVFHNGSDFDDMECVHDYSLDPNSFNIILNPEIEDEFIIKNVTKKLIMINPPNEPHACEPFSVLTTTRANNKNQILYEYDAGSNYGFSDQASMSPLPVSLMSYVRVAFTLEHTTTGKEFYYAKSFRPNVYVHETLHHYTTPGGFGGIGF
jgi:hypothetical protein